MMLSYLKIKIVKIFPCLRVIGNNRIADSENSSCSRVIYNNTIALHTSGGIIGAVWCASH